METPSSKTDRGPRITFHTLALLLGPASIVPMGMWARNANRNVDVTSLLGAVLLTLGIAALGTVLFRRSAVGRVVAAQTAVLVLWGWHVVPESVFPVAAIDLAAGLLAAVAAGWLTSHLVSFEWLPPMIGVGFGVAALAMLVTGLVAAANGDSLPDPAAPAELSGAGPGEDMVILILDAHASPSILAEVFGYDMAPTTSGLERLGFTVVEAASSNYTMTHLSVPSLLSLDYFVQPGWHSGPALSRLSRRIIAGDAGLMTWMKGIGYSVTKFEGGWEEDRCGEVSKCFAAGWRGDVTSRLLADRTPFRRIWPVHPYPITAINILEKLPTVVADAAANDRPDLIIAHVVSPHPPLFLTSDCRNRYVYGLGGGNVGTPDTPEHVAEARSSAYVEQVTCVGSHLLVLAEVLAGTDTVVLVAGDHGSDFGGQLFLHVDDWTKGQVEERFSIFAAVRVPSTCSPVPDTLVNLARFTVGCALATDVPPLTDRFLGSGGPNSPLVEVTQRVSRLRDERRSNGLNAPDDAPP